MVSKRVHELIRGVLPGAEEYMFTNTRPGWNYQCEVGKVMVVDLPNEVFD